LHRTPGAASEDKSGLYHSSDTSSVYGPTAPADLFKPGVLSGNPNPTLAVHPIYLHGPHAFYNDMSLSKNFPIFRELKMRIQAEATNVWNHPVFGSTSGAFAQGGVGRGDVQASGWATSGVTNGPRVIEFRANIEF
jgi:hypothetical protein